RRLDELGVNVEELENIDAVIATHAHIDHVGWLPRLKNALADELPTIYVTRETSHLLPVMLDDALQQLRRALAEWRIQAQHIVNRPEVVEPYDDRDKEGVLFRLSASDFGETN